MSKKTKQNKKTLLGAKHGGNQIPGKMTRPNLKHQD